MQAICIELKGTAEELGGVKFDVIVVRSPYKFAICFDYILDSVHHHTIILNRLNP
jgi:hypothetical protein